MSNVTTKSKVDALRTMMDAPSVQSQFESVLKENKSAFIASLIDLYSNDTTLQECEPKAVVFEALKAASLKLPINKQLGFSWIVPYSKSEKVGNQWVKKAIPTFQIGYKGYIQLALRTGKYRIINADVVLEGEFKTKNKLTGEVDISGTATSDKVVGYFAHIELLTGFTKTIYSTVEQVKAHAEKYVPSYKHEKSIWKTSFDEMAKKTVLRNLLSKYGFLSTELITTMSDDIQVESTERLVADEIKQNANKETVSFDSFEEVKQEPEPEIEF